MGYFRNDRAFAAVLSGFVATLTFGYCARRITEDGWLGWALAGSAVFATVLVVRSIWRDRA